MQLIDTHQHLICRNRFGYGWTNGIAPLANGDFTLANYRALTAGLGVAATIFMETGVDGSDYQAEARFVARLLGNDGLIGQVASCRPEEAAGFDDWLAECATLGVVGLRRILHDLDAAITGTDAFCANLRKIGRAGFAFDICARTGQLAQAIDLARKCDDQVLVVDHCGLEGIGDGRFEDWAVRIDELAALPHVWIKLSGITAYFPNATVALMQPWVDHVLDRFGPERVIWGGDWPVVNLGAGLPRWIAMSRELIAGLSAADQAAIGSGNATRVYGVAVA